MAFSYTEGLRILNNEPIDDRLLYPTRASVFLPGSQGGLAIGRRYENLKIFIADEMKYYRFVGGIDESNFIPDPASGGGGGGGGDAIIIADNHWFESEQARDDYFVANPGELADELMVAVKFPGEGYSYISQYYTEKEEGDPPVVEPAHWVNKYALAQGPKGDTPFINADGHWQIGEEDVGIKAEGVDGHDGSGVVTVATIDDLNPTGEVGTAYVVEDTNFIYRWDETAGEYVQVGGGQDPWSFSPLP